jgi:plasmid stability protein
MPSITLKRMSTSLHRSLKSRAKLHKRSLNQEVMSMLEAGVAPTQKADMEALLAEAKRFRESLDFMTTPAEIDKFKRMGRE